MQRSASVLPRTLGETHCAAILRPHWARGVEPGPIVGCSSLSHILPGEDEEIEGGDLRSDAVRPLANGAVVGLQPAPEGEQ